VDWEKVIPADGPLPAKPDPEPGDDAARSVPVSDESGPETAEGQENSQGTPEVVVERVPPAEPESEVPETEKPRRKRRRKAEEAPTEPQQHGVMLPVTDMAGVIVGAESAAVASLGLEPLNEGEQQALRGAWAAYLESRGEPVTPEALLALTHALVMVPRIPAIIKKFGGGNATR